jgi:hypothetical protein
LKNCYRHCHYDTSWLFHVVLYLKKSQILGDYLVSIVNLSMYTVVLAYNCSFVIKPYSSMWSDKPIYWNRKSLDHGLSWGASRLKPSSACPGSILLLLGGVSLTHEISNDAI